MSDQPVDTELAATDKDDLDAELAEFDADDADDLDAELAEFDTEDDGDGLIVGEGAFVIYDDETGETRLLVPVVIDEHGATTEVHVPLDPRAMSDLVAGLREARTAQRHLDGLPPLQRSVSAVSGTPEQNDEGEQPWSVMRLVSDRRRIDPAGVTTLTSGLSGNKFLWLVIAVVVLSIAAAIAM